MRVITLVLIFCVATIALADNPNPSELVKKADLLLRGEKSSIHLADFVVYRPGKEIKRKILVYLWGKKYSFTNFLAPISDRGTTLLKRDYDLWMYTPRLHKKMRIPFSMMHQGVQGSDFTYDDLVKEATLSDDYSHKLVGLSPSMSKGDNKVYVVDLHPLQGKPVAYKKLRLWIQENEPMILRQQFYNDDLQVVRILEFSEIRDMGGRRIPTVWKMKDVEKQDHYSVMQILKASYNEIQDESTFAPRSLQNPPPPPLWKKTSSSVAGIQYPNAKELVTKADLLIRGEKSSNQLVDFVVYRPGKVIKRKFITYLKGEKIYAFPLPGTPSGPQYHDVKKDR